MARVSSTPGCTKLLNFFEVDETYVVTGRELNIEYNRIQNDFPDPSYGSGFSCPIVFCLTARAAWNTPYFVRKKRKSGACERFFLFFALKRGITVRFMMIK